MGHATNAEVAEWIAGDTDIVQVDHLETHAETDWQDDLATVTVRGETDGRAALAVEPLQFDAATTAAPNTGDTVGDDTGDGTATGTDGPPPRSQPGFGIGAVVVAAVALLTLVRRR
jgi:MYXO-CTERM domain-containing protein